MRACVGRIGVRVPGGVGCLRVGTGIVEAARHRVSSGVRRRGSGGERRSAVRMHAADDIGAMVGATPRRAAARTVGQRYPMQ